jgi:hypothetical protein
MPETPLLAVRCPIDVLDQIKSEKNLTGRSKTDVVIDRLRNSIPSLAVTDRHKLPAIAAIYQVFTSNNNLLYIGITDNLKQDWESHPLYGQFLESDVNSRITWYNSDLPVIDPNLVKKLNSVSDTVNTDRDSHSENMVSSDQLEYAIANSEIIQNIQSRLDDMERLLRLQQSASIASPLPTGEPSPLPPSPDEPVRPAIETVTPEVSPSPPGTDAIASIDGTVTGAIGPFTDDTLGTGTETEISDSRTSATKEKGLTDSELARHLGIDKSNITRWKQKGHPTPKFKDWELIGRFWYKKSERKD